MASPKDTAAQPTAHPAAQVLAAGAVTSLHQVPRERTYLRLLLLGNANYFGNVVGSAQQAVVAIASNTTYEEITCVGFSPQADRLDAVVRLKQPFGYGGSICTAGTSEFVRFYVSTDDGATWTDAGETSFTAHDVSSTVTGTRHLQFGASVPYAAHRTLCTTSTTLRIRAILSWNHEPPPNTPGHHPVWGNVSDTTVAVDPSRRVRVVDVLQAAKVQLPATLVQAYDLEQPIAQTQQAALSTAALRELYRGKEVEPHRYAFTAIAAATASPMPAPLNIPAFGQQLFSGLPVSALDIDAVKVIDAVLATQGNTTYEELRCLGLRSQGLDDALVAVVRIKRAAGYSGGLCTAGSREYVSFWADTNDNGTFETSLGTAVVQVHDRPVPAGGLDYSVSLPVNLNALRRLCATGPRVMPVRAVLSWNTPATGPNATPTWGNHQDTLVLIPPGPAIPADDYRPILYSIGGVDPCHIDDNTGLTLDGRPFGGNLCITGSIPAALDLATPGQLQYRVTATRYAADGITVLASYTLGDPFGVQVTGAIGASIPTSSNVTQTATVDGWFTYLEYGSPALGAWQQVSNPNRLLAYWNSPTPTGPGEKWTIHIQSRRTVAPAFVFDARPVLCTNTGLTKADATITLDQQAPVVAVALTGLPCQDVTQNTTLTGTFNVTDNIGIGGISLTLEPPGPVITPVLDPASTATHKFGTWSLATAGLAPCGYVVRIDASDITVVGCGSGGWPNNAAAGFCLRHA